MLVLWILSVLLVASAISMGTWVDSTLPKTERLLLGIGLLFSILLFANFFVPITVWSSGVLLLLPILSYLYSHRHLRNPLSLQSLIEKKGLKMLLWSCFAAAVAYCGSFPTTWYDSLLYHIPAVINMTQSPIVSGLALLHIRFASTSLPFVISTLQASLPPGSSFNLPSVFFVVLFGLVVLFEKSSGKKKYESTPTSKLFLFFSLIFLFLSMKTSLLSTLAPELVVFVWTSLLLYGFLEQRRLLILLAFFLGMTTKISMVLFLPVVLVCILEALQYSRQFSTLFRSVFSRPRRLIATLLPIIMWSIYSFVVSGCFLFPIRQSCMPLENALTQMQVAEYTDTVYTWARYNPYQPIIHSETEWFSSIFIHTIPMEIWAILVVAIILLCILVVIIKTKRIQPTSMSRELVALGTQVLIVIAAYQTAPDFRLLWPFVLAFLALVVAIILSQFQLIISVPRFGVLFFQIVLGSLAVVAYVSEFSLPLRKSQLIYPVETIYNMAAPRQSHSNAPFPYTTPVAGDDRCGVAVFPCIVDPSVLATYSYSVDKFGKLDGVFHP